MRVVEVVLGIVVRVVTDLVRWVEAVARVVIDDVVVAYVVGMRFLVSNVVGGVVRFVSKVVEVKVVEDVVVMMLVTDVVNVV
jgi:hypothetical protein